MNRVTERSLVFGSDIERQALTKAFFALVDHWQLTHEETARLLGWTYANKRTAIETMRRNDSVLPPDQDKYLRVKDLINIHKSLRVLFPNQRELVYEWVKQPRKRFGGYSALDVMIQDGLSGISAIRQYLDYERTR